MEIKTKRLILRSINKNDLDILDKIYNDDYINKYLVTGFRVANTTYESIKRITEEYEKEEIRRHYDFLIEHNQIIIGMISLFINDKIGEISFCLFEKYTRNGYMHEAFTLVLDFAFEKEVMKIVNHCNKMNTRSIKLMERSNMVLVKETKACILSKETNEFIYDEYTYEITKDDYKRKKEALR